jgi:hypothetical protein
MAQTSNQRNRLWRVTSYIYTTMLSNSPVPPEVGQTLSFVSRLVPKAVEYGEMAVALLPSTSQDRAGQELPLGVEQAFLVADVGSVNDALEAAEVAINIFEIIVDSLSFQLGGIITLGQVEVIDTTAPVSLGDERELRIFSGPPYGTNIRSVEMESIRGAVSVTLPDKVPDYDAPTFAVLRWFNKSMSTNLLHDAFIFLWIALEILVDLSPIKVESPYQARCNHAIKHCPECGASTAKEVRGPTIKQYLVVAHGVNGKTAGDLWRMRQMMHGAVNFDPVKLRDLPALIQPLRAAVAEGLKRLLEIDTYAPPLVVSAGTAINPAMGIEGSRQIKAEDLQTLQVRANGGTEQDPEPAPANPKEEPADSTGAGSE